ADDGGAPPLGSGEVSEPRRERAAQAVYEHSVTGPDGGRGRAGPMDGTGDPVQGLVPRGVLPGVSRSVVADARPGNPVGGVDDLSCRAAADAEESPAVRVVTVAAHGAHTVGLDLDHHAAL